jgi:hypothetical protein
VRQRVVWLMVLGAAVAVAVVYHVRTRARVGPLGHAWEPLPAPERPPSPGVAPAISEPAAGEEAPTGAPVTVVATMEATPAAPVTTPYEGNGSVVAPVAATAAPVGQFTRAELPQKRRPSGATLAGLAAVVGLGAIALGAWGVATTVSEGDSTGAIQTVTAVEGVQQVISLAAKPTSARIPFQGAGRQIILVVGARGYGVLVFPSGFERAPTGKTYQAWVIKPNVEAPASAAIFSGKELVVPLTTPVPPGAVVAITVEKAGGVPAPTQTPKILAKRAAA